MPFQLDHVDTVVLAGGRNSAQLYDGYTPGYKALLEFNGKPSICYTLEALSAVPQVARICIAGPEAVLNPAIAPFVAGKPRYDFVPGGETLMDSIYSGLEHFAGSEMVLLITADIPLVTPQAIGDFLAACAPVETTSAQNLCLSMAPKSSFTGAYAGYSNGFNRFRDISICYGSLMLVNPRLLQNTGATRRINSLYNNRKNPLSTPLAIGMHVGLTYVLGVHLWHLLSIEKMAHIASSRFGLGLIPIVINHPEITINVDEPEDYEFVKAQLTPVVAQ